MYVNDEGGEVVENEKKKFEMNVVLGRKSELCTLAWWLFPRMSIASISKMVTPKVCFS